MMRWTTGRTLLLAALALAVYGCHESTGPQYVDAINILPATVYTVVGDSVAIEIEVVGPDGELYPDRLDRVKLGINNDEVASLEIRGTGAMIKGLDLGTTQITAELGRGEGSARVFVEPPGLDRVTITPSEINLTVPGGIGVYAHLWDADGNEISPAPYHISWYVADERVASVLYKDATPTTLRARSRGQTSLKLTVGGVSSTVIVTVN